MGDRRSFNWFGTVRSVIDLRLKADAVGVGGRDGAHRVGIAALQSLGVLEHQFGEFPPRPFEADVEFVHDRLRRVGAELAAAVVVVPTDERKNPAESFGLLIQ